jgi:hypothetical protein
VPEDTEQVREGGDSYAATPVATAARMTDSKITTMERRRLRTSIDRTLLPRVDPFDEGEWFRRARSGG